MGMQIDRRPIDKRLLEDEGFLDFFLDESEKLQSDRGPIDELDADDAGNLMRNSAYVDELYKKYQEAKGIE